MESTIGDIHVSHTTFFVHRGRALGTRCLQHSITRCISITISLPIPHSVIMMRFVFVAVLTMLLSGCQRYDLPQGTLSGCGPTLRLDIVSTHAQRQKGLMHQTSLPAQYGMLFVFKEDTQPAFWMRDTPIALDVVFMRVDGTIVQISAMQPNTDTAHAAQVPIRYALETPQGWMARHGVQVGDQCTLDVPPLMVE